MYRSLRPLARVVALLLSASVGSQALACYDVTFSFQNTTGVLIRVNTVRVFDATTGAATSYGVLKECFSGFTCVTPALNLSPAVVGDALTQVRFRIQPWNGAGWGPGAWTAWYPTAAPVCQLHRDYGPFTI